MKRFFTSFKRSFLLILFLLTAMSCSAKYYLYGYSYGNSKPSDTSLQLNNWGSYITSSDNLTFEITDSKLISVGWHAFGISTNSSGYRNSRPDQIVYIDYYPNVTGNITGAQAMNGQNTSNCTLGVAVYRITATSNKMVVKLENNGTWNNTCNGTLYTIAKYKTGTMAACNTSAPQVTTNAATNVTISSAKLNAAITSLGQSEMCKAYTVTASGIKLYSDAGCTSLVNTYPTNPTVSSVTSYSASATGLSPNTTYWYKAYITYSDGTIYGNAVSFTTPGPSLSIAIDGDATMCSEGVIDYSIVVTNNSTEAATNVVINYVEPDGSIGSESVASLAAGAAKTIERSYYAPTTTSGNVVSISADANCYGGTLVSATKTVNVYPQPIEQLFTYSDLFFCGDEGVTIGLNGSQSGVTYVLTRGGSDVKTVSGSGSAITFPGTYGAGTYKIRAYYDATYCWTTFGELKITQNPLPAVFSITSSDTEYCAGGATAGVHIGLSGSETGILYKLWKSGSVVAELIGTGGALDFGIQKAGYFTVEAENTNTDCYVYMDGSVTVKENPLPAVYNFKTTDTKFCEGGGVRLYLEDSELGITYNLYKDGVFNSSVAGTGSELDMMLVCKVPGTYKVIAENATTGCEVEMNGTLTIVKNGLPDATIEVTGASEICHGTEATIKLTATAGAPNFYITYNNGITDVTVSDVADSYSLTQALYSTTRYTLKSIRDANGCTNNYGASKSVTVTVDDAPEGSAGILDPNCNSGNFTLAGTLTKGTGVWTSDNISVIFADATNPTTTITGVPLNETATLTWTVSNGVCPDAVSAVRAINNDCTDLTAVIGGVGNICAGGTLRYKITITNGSTLAANNVVVNYIKPDGTSAAEIFNSIAPGASEVINDTYSSAASTVISQKEISVTAQKEGGDLIRVSKRFWVNPLPEDQTITASALSYCKGSNVKIGLAGSQNGINYTLYRGNGVEAATMSGSGSSFEFSGNYTADTYTVKAVDPATSCNIDISGSLEIKENQLPSVTLATTNNTSCAAPLNGSYTITASNGRAPYTYSSDGGATYSTQNEFTGLQSQLNIKARVKDYNGCESAIKEGSVENKAVQPVIHRVTTTNNGEYCEGATSDVHIVVAGSQTEFNYQLYKDNSTTSTPQLVPVGNAISGTGSELDFGAFEAGKYYVKAESKVSETCDAFMNDNAVVITENPKPVLTYKVYEKGTTKEVVSPYVLTCDVPEMDIVLEGGATYEWNDGETLQTRTVSESFSKSVYPVSDKGCPGESVTITITVEKETPKDVVIASDPADADLTLTCKNQEITLTASSSTANVTYKWNDAAQTEGPVLKVSDISTQATYKVTVTAANGCTSESEVEIKENKNKPVVSVVSKDETGAVNELLDCTHPELTLTASVSNTQVVGNCTYVWSTLSQASYSTDNPLDVTSANVYSVVATGENGCASDKVDKVINEDFRKPEIITDPVEVCMPATVDISTAISSRSKFDEIFFYETSSATVPMASTIVEVSETTTYYAQAVGLDGNGCISEYEPNQPYNPIVISERRLADTPTVVPYDECPVPGKKSMRDLVTSDKTNLKFYDSIEGGSEVSDMFDAATENSEYTYYVSNTTKDQCESERAEINIHVDGTIDYDLIASAEEVIAAQEEVTLTVVPTKENRIEKYVWTKNGVQMDIDEPEITDILYVNSEFAVTASGRCNSITKKQTVRALWPTAIVPDGPGRNGEFAKGCNITVFNRFNEKVFEGNDGWDGTLNCALAKKGVKADPGVYYYYMTFPDGSTHKGIIEVVKF